jgi:hypothetical protein
MRSTVTCSVLFALASPLLADDGVLLTKDLRAKGSNSAYSVVLAARSGGVGHAMVILGREDGKKMVSSIEAFGFYPKEGKGVLGPVPGMIADELAQGKGVARANTRVILRVDKEQFDKIDAVRKKWLQAKYQVLEADCVTFTSEVATTLGLKIPNRETAKLPVAFIEKIAELNK